jgi:hypothetical protein
MAGAIENDHELSAGDDGQDPPVGPPRRLRSVWGLRADLEIGHRPSLPQGYVPSDRHQSRCGVTFVKIWLTFSHRQDTVDE